MHLLLLSLSFVSSGFPSLLASHKASVASRLMPMFFDFFTCFMNVLGKIRRPSRTLNKALGHSLRGGRCAVRERDSGHTMAMSGLRLN
ncbi:hypothetical protein C8R43DRAFT_975971, partial [Mycena crocata]